MTSKMFYKRFFVFVLLLIALFAVVGVSTISETKEQVFKLKKPKHNVILGSSTTEAAVNDTILSSYLNLSTSADPYLYSYLKLSELLKFNKVDTLILAISPISFSKYIDSHWTFNNLHFESRFGNYYWLMSLEDYDTLYKHMGFSFFKSAIYSYFNRSFKDFLRALSGNIKQRFGGYKPLQRHKLEEAIKRLQEEEDAKYSLSGNQIYYFNKILSLCKKNEIKVILISTPVYKLSVQKNSEMYKEFKKFIKANYPDYIYYDFTLFPLDNKFFADIPHLRYEGSVIFTNVLKDSLVTNK